MYRSTRSINSFALPCAPAPYRRTALAGACLATALLSLAPPARADQPNPPTPLNSAPAVGSVTPITPTAVVAEVLESNPELRFYAAEISAARASRRSAATWPAPQLETTIGRKAVRGFGFEDEGTAWSVSLLQPIEWSGRVGLRKAIANRDIELATLGEQRFRAALAAKARALAHALLAAQDRQNAATEVAERFQAVQAVLVQRDPSGLTPLLESRVIEATTLTVQRQASAARLAVDSARLELNRLRAVSPTRPLEITPTPLDFEPAPDHDTLLAMARTNNFELRVRSTELAQQGLRVELARRERYPPLSIGPTFIEENAGDREQVLGLALSLPLPLWQRNQAGIEAAQARRVQAEVALDVAQRDLDRQVIEAALAYETHRQALAVWRADAAQHFKDAAALADRHYRLGAVPIATYLELQKQYLEAIEALIETRRELLEAADQLEQLTGLTSSLAHVPPPATP